MTTRPRDAALSPSAFCFLVSLTGPKSQVLHQELRGKDLYHFYQKFSYKKYDFLVKELGSHMSHGMFKIKKKKVGKKKEI